MSRRVCKSRLGLLVLEVDFSSVPIHGTFEITTTLLLTSEGTGKGAGGPWDWVGGRTSVRMMQHELWSPGRCHGHLPRVSQGLMIGTLITDRRPQAPC